MLLVLTDKELNVCFKKGLCADPRDSWFQGQIGFLEKYILPLAERSQVYFEKEFADALIGNARHNLKLWNQHGVEATAMMVNAADNGEDEPDVLVRLYELQSL